MRLPLYFSTTKGEMNMVNKMTAMVIGAIGMAAVSAVMSVVDMVQNARTRRSLKRGIEKVEEMSDNQIADAMIEKAVAKSADRKVDRYMADTEDAVLRTARKDLEIQARNAVVNAANEIRESTSTEIARQVAMLDIEQLKKRVCDQAEKDVLKKFDHCLDDSLKKFQDQLDNTRKIYEGLTRAMAEKKEGEQGFKFVVMS